MEVRSIEAIIGALNGVGARYLVVGGLAVNAHGFARMTRDVDLVLELQPDNILLGLNALFEIGYKLAIPVSAEDFANADNRRRWRAEKEMIVLKLWSDQHGRTPIDVFIYEPFDFSTEIENSVNLEVSPGVSAAIVSLETLVRMKRDASRPQDLTDIEELLRLQ